MKALVRFVAIIVVILLLTNNVSAQGMELLDQEKADQVKTTYKPSCPQDTPEGLTTQQYIDRYLEMNKGNADKAHGNAYIDRMCEQEPFQNLARRDAEHYLWSLYDVRKNNYQYVPSLIRTLGYSVVKVPQYYGKKGLNKVRTSLGYDELKTTTPPTMKEMMWGFRGSNAALFGLD